MKKIMRSLGVGSIALACVFVSGTSANAASASGAKYNGCKNSVKVWRSGAKVYAQGKMTCDKKVRILRPASAISSYKNGKLKDYNAPGQMGSCRWVKTCTSPKASLKATKGWDYRGSNSGTASTGVPGEMDGWWPKRTQAHATYKYR
ncbi:hypothetical protein J7E96_29750 [Streptomyces sp. ISL-96]|uniref:hypothetical protein n=1 Tax=Streptomyces sp. ISL-96 TaxID=2819191 RepID=UPI001BE8C384|nr:hypothetical protein [Streptomyces sp. ISL-96]MBT2492620.1 hypothetical protein [Streptomyces sp. ISL-96]